MDEERQLGQLLATQELDQYVTVVDGKLHTRLPDIEELLTNGSAKFRLLHRSLIPIAVEKIAISTSADAAFDGVLDTIINDGEEDLRITFNGSSSWLTIKSDEAWSPDYLV